MREWNWEPDDFAALWYGDGIDRFPRPLYYRSRFRYAEDFHAHAAAVRDRLPAADGDRISDALRILAASPARIEILGGTAMPGQPRRQYRIVGAHTDRTAV